MIDFYRLISHLLIPTILRVASLQKQVFFVCLFFFYNNPHNFTSQSYNNLNCKVSYNVIKLPLNNQ